MCRLVWGEKNMSTFGFISRTCQHLTYPLYSTPKIDSENDCHLFEYPNFYIMEAVNPEQNICILQSLHVFKKSPTANVIL